MIAIDDTSQVSSGAGAADRWRDRLPLLPPRPTLYPTAITILKALVVGRWLSWTWMVVVVAFERDDDPLRHPIVAWLAVAATLGLTATSTALLRRRPERLIHLPFVLAEVGLAVGLSVVDGYVFEPGHVFATTQSLATQWPLIAAATAGVAFGPFVAGALGALVGPAEWGGAALNGVRELSFGQALSLLATSLFYAALGAVFGWQARLLKRVESEIADRRARDEIGRVMHDTVLQTLALVTRRTATTDPSLAAAAREADLELRAFLFGSLSRVTADLEALVRAAVERVRRGHDTPVTVSVLDDGCTLAVEHQEIVARAIGEAVANALEHAEAQRIVVFVETDTDGHVFASVDDDGRGFDPAAPRSSHGLDQSIIGRIESIGGRVTVTSSSAGTEICIWSRRS